MVTCWPCANFRQGAGPASRSVAGHLTPVVRLAPAPLLFVGGGVVMVMTDNAFATTWWPLHVATAWVLSRDRDVTERHARVKGSTPSLFIGFEDATGRPQSFESVKSAWNALHEGDQPPLSGPG